MSRNRYYSKRLRDFEIDVLKGELREIGISEEEIEGKSYNELVVKLAVHKDDIPRKALQVNIESESNKFF